MVPDIVHIFTKGNGIFSNVPSLKHKAKLRVLYEVAAVIFLMEKAGGKTVVCVLKSESGKETNGLDYIVAGFDDRM